MKSQLLTMTLVLGLSLGLTHAPLVAQTNGKVKQKDRVEQRDRGLSDWERVLSGQANSTGNGSGKVPPGWCQGAGNPHNTPANCGYSSRDGRVSGGRGGSYEQSHAQFHRDLDAYYNRLAAQRPLDVQYQLQLRLQKSAEHEEWHRRMGIAH